MSTKAQVATLAARGMTAAAISRELGITEGYISQLGSDDEYTRIYNELVSKQQVATHSKHAQIDNHYDSLEHKLLSTLDANSDLILAAFMDKPATLLASIRTLNSAKRRSVGEAQPRAAAESEYVALVLPAYLIAASTPKVQHNSRNEVVDIDGTALVSLPSSALRTKLADHQSTELSKRAVERIAQWEDDDAPLDLTGL